jgi:hypothetical protein
MNRKTPLSKQLRNNINALAINFLFYQKLRHFPMSRRRESLYSAQTKNSELQKKRQAMMAEKRDGQVASFEKRGKSKGVKTTTSLLSNNSNSSNSSNNSYNHSNSRGPPVRSKHLKHADIVPRNKNGLYDERILAYLLAMIDKMNGNVAVLDKLNGNVAVLDKLNGNERKNGLRRSGNSVIGF